MKSSFNELKDLVSKMNNLSDQISFIKFNNDDGAKFNNIEEMKDFISKIENGNFNFILDNENIQAKNIERRFIESFVHTKDDLYFFIYTYEKNDKYVTYLSIKNLNDNYIIDNLYGKENNNKELAHTWFNEIKNNIIDNSIDTIINDLINGAKNTIKQLEIELQELASAS